MRVKRVPVWAWTHFTDRFYLSPPGAPGRTVSVRTEEREVVLARYGCDIEMSTNLMAGEPELAAADLKIKLDFQKRQLDRKCVFGGIDEGEWTI